MPRSGSWTALGLTLPPEAVRLFGAAIKVGTPLNSQRLVMNIANDMRLRLKHHFATLDGSLDFTVHDHSLCGNSSDDLGLRETMSAVQCRSPSIRPLTSTNPSAVTLPRILRLKATLLVAFILSSHRRARVLAARWQIGQR